MLDPSGWLEVSGSGDLGSTCMFKGFLSDGGTWSNSLASGTWSAERTGDVGDVTSFAGNWSGTYGGAHSGTWGVTVDGNGLIKGTATEEGDEASLFGVVTGSGAVTLGDVIHEDALYQEARFVG